MQSTHNIDTQKEEDLQQCFGSGTFFPDPDPGRKKITDLDTGRKKRIRIQGLKTIDGTTINRTKIAPDNEFGRYPDVRYSAFFPLNL